MKKLFLFLGTVIGMFLLSGCGQGIIEMLDFIDFNFKGLDTRGTASYFVDYERLRNYLIENDKELAFESNNVYYDDKQLEEMLGINLDKNSELSNEDSVKLTLMLNATENGTTEIQYMGQTVHHCCRKHWIFKGFFPTIERQVRRDDHRASSGSVR